jgi:Transposase domain (DUF772)
MIRIDDESERCSMRGRFRDQGRLFHLHITGGAGAAEASPLADQGTGAGHSLGKLYSSEGRPSMPPEQLLSALLLQVFYSIRSERQLMEQLDYNPLYRWFVGLAPDDPVWDATTFTKNRAARRRVPEVHDEASEPGAAEAAFVGRAFR